jgi:hypothetical protein
MRENGKKTKRMVKENTFILMEQHTKEIGLMISRKVMV